MQIPSISSKNALGFVDKIVGLGKEFLGEIVGRKSLIEAGEAQQDKGTERLKALRLEVEAQAHEAKAKSHEKREQAAANA